METDGEIVAWLAQAKEQDGRLVSVVDSVLDRLEKQGLAYRLSIPARFVGVHHQNRSGYGVSEPEVHALGSEIIGMGWSWQACSHAVCIEDDDKKSVEQFTLKAKRSSEGLGVARAGEIRYGSLSCSHTNQFLCAVLDEVPCSIPEISSHGRICRAQLESHDDALKGALSNGLKWLVLKACVGELYPSLCDLVQEACNGPGQSQRSESEMQILLRIQASARAMSAKNNGQVDWLAVQSTILRTRVQSPSDVPDLIRFVQRWGGGDDGYFISDLNDFHQKFVPSGRIISGASFKAVADLKLGPNELVPYFASALIKTQATCPENKVSNRVCAFLRPQDIQSVERSKKPEVLRAELVLRLFRDIGKAHHLNAADSTRIFGKLDTSMVRHVLKKPMSEKFDSIEDVARSCVQELEAKVGHQVEHPWSVLAAPTALLEPTAAIPNFVQFDEHGNAVGAQRLTLQHKGFGAGVVVIDKDGKQGTIGSISAQGLVRVQMQKRGCDAMNIDVQYDDFLSSYQVCKAVSECFTDWEECMPRNNLVYLEAVVKAHIQVCVAMLGEHAPTPKIYIQLKPNRAVFADGNYPTGKLQLVPETSRISTVASESDAPSGAFKCNVSEETGKDFYLMPSFSTTFAAPAWAVRTSAQRDAANLDITMKKVNVKISHAKGKDKSIDVEIPLIVNTKHIKKDEELILYRDVPKKTSSATAHHMTFQSDPKRQKV